MKFSMRDSQHRWAKEKAKQTQSGAFFNKLKSYSVKLVKPKVCMNLYVCRQQTSLAALSTLQGPLVDPRPSWYHRFFPDFLDLLSYQIWIFFYQIIWFPMTNAQSDGGKSLIKCFDFQRLINTDTELTGSSRCGRNIRSPLLHRCSWQS